MGRTYEGIDDRLARFFERQHVFFVATAPSGGDGHVNLSPKGLDGTFAVLDAHTVAYLDLTGSGVETIAHLRENGRIVVMFCAFEGPPRIVRLHGRGEAVLAGDPRFPELAGRFPARPGVRSVIVVGVERIADSCGYGVPRMRFEAERDELDRWAERKGADGIARYQATRNAQSIDGLPGLSDDEPGRAAAAASGTVAPCDGPPSSPPPALADGCGALPQPGVVRGGERGRSEQLLAATGDGGSAPHPPADRDRRP